MDALREIAEEEMFQARLKENTEMPPEEKRRRLRKLEQRAKRPARAVIENGQRFDRMEYPTDVPVSPWYGNTLPSRRGGRGAQRKETLT